MKGLVLTLILGVIGVANAEGRSYVPLHEVSKSSDFALSVPAPPVRFADRPSLPGMRPFEVELLEDALRRKQPLSVGHSRARAHKTIIRASLRDPVKRGHIRGDLAEALYLNGNKDWGYVRNARASQHDLYRWVDGRRAPLTAQIKTHSSGNALTYARDMASDHRSNLFIVPDDHVASLRAHWQSEVERLGNDSPNALEARRQLNRVRALGYTSSALDSHLSNAVRHALRERNAAYVSLGVGFATAAGPGAWEFIRTGSMRTEEANSTVKALSVLTTERVVTMSLERWGAGALRGSLRGNALAAIALLAVDTGWSVYEVGPHSAFRSPAFFTHLGGSVGGLALGYAVGTPVSVGVTLWIAPFAGPWAAPIGGMAGLITGAAASIGAYWGAEYLARELLQRAQPELELETATKEIALAKDLLSARIVHLERSELRGAVSATNPVEAASSNVGR